MYSILKNRVIFIPCELGIAAAIHNSQGMKIKADVDTMMEVHAWG